MPSPQEPHTPSAHLMPFVPQFASLEHCTQPFSALLQYGAAPKQSAFERHVVQTPRSVSQTGATPKQF
jgi:hypothetical protein